MSRPRMMVPIAAIAAVLTLGPALAGAAIAADPTVVVKGGDTLTAIAKRHGVKISAIVTANRIADPTRIVAGPPPHLDRPRRQPPRHPRSRLPRRRLPRRARTSWPAART